MKNKDQNGFTIIELLVVISIISLLSTIVLTAVNPARAKSRDARRVEDIRSLFTAVELYENNNAHLPNCSDPGYAGGCDLVSYSGLLTNSDSSQDRIFMQFLVNAGLISASSLDPLNSGGYMYAYGTNGEYPVGSGNFYTFCVASVLEDPNNPALAISITAHTPQAQVFALCEPK